MLVVFFLSNLDKSEGAAELQVHDVHECCDARSHRGLAGYEQMGLNLDLYF